MLEGGENNLKSKSTQWLGNNSSYQNCGHSPATKPHLLITSPHFHACMHARSPVCTEWSKQGNNGRRQETKSLCDFNIKEEHPQ